MNAIGDGRCGHNFPPKECPYAHCGYKATLERLEKCGEELEQERVRHAGCLTAAEGWAGNNPPVKGGYGWSPAFQAVLDLRKRLEQCEALNKFARHTIDCRFPGAPCDCGYHAARAALEGKK